MNKLWIIPICLFIIGFYGQFWILGASDMSFEFKIDEDTREAIELLTEYNGTLIINNIHENAQYSCVKGCELMHEAIVSHDGAASQQGKDGKFYYVDDCVLMCEENE